MLQCIYKSDQTWQHRAKNGIRASYQVAVNAMETKKTRMGAILSEPSTEVDKQEL